MRCTACFRTKTSAFRRNECPAGFRRVPVAGERNVGHLAGSPGQLREALQDRRTIPQRCSTRSRQRKNSIRASRRRIPVGFGARPGVASTVRPTFRETPLRLKRRQLKAGVDFRSFLRAIVPFTSHMPSPTATRPAITPISGAKCSMRTPSNGLSNTVA